MIPNCSGSEVAFGSISHTTKMQYCHGVLVPRASIHGLFMPLSHKLNIGDISLCFFLSHPGRALLSSQFLSLFLPSSICLAAPSSCPLPAFQGRATPKNSSVAVSNKESYLPYHQKKTKKTKKKNTSVKPGRVQPHRRADLGSALAQLPSYGVEYSVAVRSIVLQDLITLTQVPCPLSSIRRPGRAPCLALTTSSSSPFPTMHPQRSRHGRTHTHTQQLGRWRQLSRGVSHTEAYHRYQALRQAHTLHTCTYQRLIYLPSYLHATH